MTVKKLTAAMKAAQSYKELLQVFLDDAQEGYIEEMNYYIFALRNVNTTLKALQDARIKNASDATIEFLKDSLEWFQEDVRYHNEIVMKRQDEIEDLTRRVMREEEIERNGKPGAEETAPF